jgi:hypothetical protein
MSWKIHPKEFETVIALDGPGRYEHFVKRVADWREVWSLRDEEGWYLSANPEGRETVPVWPHERYASACSQGAWSGGTPVSIALDDWMEKWLPGIERDRRLVSVLPTPAGVTVIVEPARLRNDLRNYLEEWYGE